MGGRVLDAPNIALLGLAPLQSPSEMIKKLSALFLALCASAAFFATTASAAHHESHDRVFELRIYYPHPGKIDDLLTRFRDHTCGIFERLGIENIGYWVESEVADGEEPKLYYVIAHESRDAASAAWGKFRDDEEWKSAYAKSIENGRLVQKVDSIFMNPADFSAIK